MVEIPEDFDKLGLIPVVNCWFGVNYSVGVVVGVALIGSKL